jgi:hypothetical protein
MVNCWHSLRIEHDVKGISAPMAVYFPPALFLIAVACALLGVDPPGATSDPGLDESLLLWTIYLSFGWAGIGAGISHTLFARQTAAGIGWQTGDFQYEVGFADLARGLGAIYAVHSASQDAWVAISIVAGGFMVLAGLNHIRGMAKAGNFAPGNSLIVLANFGAPIVALAALVSVGAV